ncbi:MAG: hypothetical protein A2W03_17745 [Candidatus Aminicenantes bacterium RBG_16_63_16]|nr:MAG: hypothetical protein A2W03_17745 [Candidatus Aminicenantes bacterium RBG_16_63_16]
MPAVAALAVALLTGFKTATVVPQDGGNPVQAMVRRLELGRPVSHGNLTIVPVYLNRVLDRTRYATLEDALKNGWITITEVEGGRVPQVKISNLSKQLIFLMGGEILTGCRQDRILAGDILLAPGTRDLLAPVFCVEQGRWTHISQNFFSKQNLGTPALRARAQEKSPAAQSQIWGKIAEENEVMGVSSSTGAYQDAYEKDENRARIMKIEEKMSGIPRLHADTVGVVVGLGGEVVSADIFTNPDLFLKQWPKILKSSALSSLGSAKGGALDRNAAAGFLESFMGRKYRSQAGLDLGLEYSAIDSAANIQALVYNDATLHLAGFPQDEDRLKVIRDDRGDPMPAVRLR